MASKADPRPISSTDLAALQATLAAIATSGSGADLAAASVVLAKLANLGVNTSIGRKSASAGVPEAITPGWFSQDIDLKAAANNYEVIAPCPFRMHIAQAVWVPTALTSCSTGPTGSLGSNSTNFDNVVPSTTFTGFQGGTAFLRVSMTTSGTVVDLTTSGLRVKITTPATATTLTGRVLVLGMLCPV